jgi:hypothetical protein
MQEETPPELYEDTPPSEQVLEETAPPIAEEKTRDELDAEESGDLVALALAKADKVAGGTKEEKKAPPPRPRPAQKKSFDFRTLHKMVRDDDMKDDDEWVSKEETEDSGDKKEQGQRKSKIV